LRERVEETIVLGRRVLVGGIKVYRRWISPLFPPSCRYYPSCSTYALQAIEKHGAVKGFGMSVWRILRCNPFSSGGFDPVK
jgi:putative membrane protein insertion efficiency factor